MNKQHEKLDEESVTSEMFASNQTTSNFVISEHDIADASDDVDLVSVSSMHKDKTDDIGQTPANTPMASNTDQINVEDGLGLGLGAEPPVVQNIRDDEVSDDEMSNGSGGYIDEELKNQVLAGSQDRINQARNAMYKKFCMYGLIVFSAFLGMSLISDSDSSVRRDIERKGSAYNFDDADDYPGSIPETSNEQTVFDTPIPFSADYPVASFSHIIDVRGPAFKKGQTPFFWHQPQACQMLEKTLTHCYSLTLAHDKSGPANLQGQLHVFNLFESNRQYVNVDLSTEDGIRDAAAMGLISSGKANVVASDKLHYTASSIFDPGHYARAFTIMRHPVDRAIASYHQFTTNHDDFADMSLEDFIKSEHYHGNGITTVLSHNGDYAYQKHLKLAKELLRTKFLVGLHNRLSESLALFDDYFFWNGSSPEMAACKKEMIQEEVEKDLEIFNHAGGHIRKHSHEYNMIAAQNTLDIELYHYAVALHNDQRAWIPKQEVIGDTQVTTE